MFGFLKKRSENVSENSLQVGKRKSTLSINERLHFYSQLGLYLKNNHKLDVALTEMYNIYSEDGRKPRNKVALMLKEILVGIATGYSFSHSIATYIPEEEFFLISAGDKSSFLMKSMEQATRLIKGKQRISSSVRKAYVYNTFLGLMLVGVLIIAAFYLIPQSMMMIEPEQLTGFAYAVYAMSEFVIHYGIYVLILVFAFLFLVRWAQPNYIGRRRIYLDRFWPFSLYRTVNGTTFLISLSSLMQANVAESDALMELAEHANPYIKQRIMAARSGIHHGYGLGESLHISGYDFPHPLAIRHLRILGSKSGVEHAISSFADDWLEETIIRTDAAADIARNVGLVLVFLVAGTVVLGTAMIQQASQNAMGIM